MTAIALVEDQPLFADLSVVLHSHMDGLARSVAEMPGETHDGEDEMWECQGACLQMLLMGSFMSLGFEECAAAVMG